MSKYQNGKIYKIVNDTLNLTYYGSTCQKYLSSRFYIHKKEKDNKKYTSNKLFEEGEAKIFLVELFPCESKLELEKRERYYIENNECVNINIPSRTIKEWRETNKEKIKEKNKIYRETNKEIIKAKQKIREANKDKLKDKKDKKDYYEKNKEKIKEQSKINYHKKREEQLKKNRIRYALNKDKYNETRRLKYQTSKLKNNSLTD